MPKKLEVYKCEVCGNIVEVLHAGKGQLVCCGQPMVLQEEQTEDQGYEKHVPVIEETAEGIKVKVGSTTHPMLEEHYIEWIELIADGKVYREHLQPGQEPVAVFPVEAEEYVAREYCSVHGHWQSE
ncbi:MAG: desulfoferrodoxin [Halanaerobium sp.]|nr:desulfoferrodoxin [Halanaerobium sp.]